MWTVAEHSGGTRDARAGGGSGTALKQSTGKRSTHYHHTNNGGVELQSGLALSCFSNNETRTQMPARPPNNTRFEPA